MAGHRPKSDAGMGRGESRDLTDAVEKGFVTVANRDSVDFAL